MSEEEGEQQQKDPNIIAEVTREENVPGIGVVHTTIRYERYDPVRHAAWDAMWRMLFRKATEHIDKKKVQTSEAESNENT